MEDTYLVGFSLFVGVDQLSYFAAWCFMLTGTTSYFVNSSFFHRQNVIFCFTCVKLQTNSSLSTYQQVCSSTQAPLSLHVEVSLGKILNPTFPLKAEAQFQSQVVTTTPLHSGEFQEYQ